jgi:hypothetical protein
MKKLKLESLSVQTFETVRPEGTTGGTVAAYGWTRVQDQTCAGMSCDYVCITVYDHTCPNICP